MKVIALYPGLLSRVVYKGKHCHLSGGNKVPNSVDSYWHGKGRGGYAYSGVKRHPEIYNS